LIWLKSEGSLTKGAGRRGMLRSGSPDLDPRARNRSVRDLI